MVTVELSTAGEVPERATVAVAPLPPPPLMTTLGTAVYFWVLGVTVKVAALTPRLVVAFAPLPTPVTETVAGAVMILPYVAVTFADITPPLGAFSTAAAGGLRLNSAPL